MNLIRAVYKSSARIRLQLQRERQIFNNRGVILTLIIHWLGPPLFFLWCFMSMHTNHFDAHFWPWLDYGLPPRCPPVVRCHWGEIEPFSAMLAQYGLAECDQPGKFRSEYSATAGNRPRATERTDSEIHSFSHWAIITRVTGRTDSEIHSFSHWAIMTLATGRTDREIHSFSHWTIVSDAQLSSNWLN